MSDYYKLYNDSLAEATDDNQAIVKAVLALAEQIRGLRVDLSNDEELA